MEHVESVKNFSEIEQAIAKLRTQSGSVFSASGETEHDLVYRHLLGAASRFELSTQTLSLLESRSNELVARVKSLPDVSSRLPGGSILHRIINRLCSRQITHNQQQAESQTLMLTEFIAETKRLFEAQRSADERQLTDLLASVVDRLAIVDSLEAERSLLNNQDNRPAE